MIELTRSWLLFLIPLPLAVWYLLPPLAFKRVLAVPLGLYQLLSELASTVKFNPMRFNLASLAAVTGWIALLIALANPIKPAEDLINNTGRSIIFAVDLSASMGEVVEGESRLQSVFQMLNPLLDSRRGDRVALIAFASDAYLISPFTYDVKALKQVLEELTIGLPGRKTDLGQAIGLAVKQVRDAQVKSATLVITTDGETNTGELSALDAANMARQMDMMVNIVGFGQQIKPLNRDYMRELADITGGQYTEASTGLELEGIYSQIEETLNQQPVNEYQQDKRLYTDLTWIPLMFALLALFVYVHQLRSEQ